MIDLVLDVINVLGNSVWSGITVAVAILVAALGLLVRTIHENRPRDLTRHELRLLKAFSEQAKGNPRAYLSAEFAAYRAEVDKYEVGLRRLKESGYLQDSNIEAGYLGHRPVWITAKGIRRAEKKR
jgi:hypothetical protein